MLGEGGLLSESKALQRVITALTWLGGIAMLLMMVHIVADVVARLVFNHPFNGTMEIVAGYDMVAVIFFPLAFVTHFEGHIRVELFTRGLSPRASAVLDVVVGAVCLAMLVWFTWQSALSAYNSYMSGEQLETAASLVTIWPSRLAIPIGLLVMGIYMACRLIDDIRIALGWR